MANANVNNCDINLTGIHTRLGVVEAELSKITSTLNEISKEFNSFTSAVATFVDRSEVDAIKKQLDSLEQICHNNSVSKQLNAACFTSGDANQILDEKYPCNVNASSSKFLSNEKQGLAVISPTSMQLDLLPISNKVNEIENNSIDIKRSSSNLNVDHDDINNEPSSIEENLSPLENVTHTQLNSNWQGRVKSLEVKINDMEKGFTELREQYIKTANLETTAPLATTTTSPEIDAINQSVEALQNHMDRLQECYDLLLNENETQNEQIDSITDDLENVSNSKTDEGNVTVVPTDKIDTNQVKSNAKLNALDTDKHIVSKDFIHMISKLVEKAETWREMMDDLKDKLDKNDKAALKEFLNEKIKKLQERVKALTSLKKQVETVDNRSGEIKNMNCISCNTDAIMLMNPCPTIVTQYELPSYIKPCITKTLDQLRLERKLRASSFNLDLDSLEESLKSHLPCLRNCVGIHTKFNRCNHFVHSRPHTPGGGGHCWRSHYY